MQAQIDKINLAVQQGQGNEAFIYACEVGQLDSVKLLLQNPKVDPASMDNSAFKLACQNNNLEIVQLLLEDKRVSPTSENNYAFKFAAQSGHLAIVKLLMNDSRIPNAAKISGAKLARKGNHTDILELLDPTGTIAPANPVVKECGLAKDAKFKSSTGWVKPTADWSKIGDPTASQ
ncbi:hypothetical protein BC833DRAFT_612821 [Globomyces pollinis-pini]|nr:hypothetical protein BC833DRAFT_612821 [Globomyces pollinis-pini]